MRLPNPMRYARDILRDRRLMWVNRMYYSWVALGVLLPGDRPGPGARRLGAVRIRMPVGRFSANLRHLAVCLERQFPLPFDRFPALSHTRTKHEQRAAGIADVRRGLAQQSSCLPQVGAFRAPLVAIGPGVYLHWNPSAARPGLESLDPVGKANRARTNCPPSQFSRSILPAGFFCPSRPSARPSSNPMNRPRKLTSRLLRHCWPLGCSESLLWRDYSAPLIVTCVDPQAAYRGWFCQQAGQLHAPE